MIFKDAFFLLIAILAIATLPPTLTPLQANTFLAQSDPRLVEADRLLEQGIEQYRTGNPTSSRETLQQALTRYQQLSDHPKIVRTLRNIGNTHLLQANYEPAITYFQQSLGLARQIEDGEGEAAALGNLGVIYANLGNYKQAEEYYQQALQLNRARNDRLGEGQTLGNLAEVFYTRNEYPQAIEVLQQAIAIARSIDDSRLEANSLGTLGVIYYSLSDYPKAIDYAQQQLQLSRRLQDPIGEAAALNNLGNTYYAQGNYGQAIAYLEQRLTLSRTIQDRLGQTQSLGNLSAVYDDIGDYSKAIEYAFQGLSLAREIKNPVAEASFLTRLGNIYYVAQDFPKAIEYHQQRLILAQQANNLSSTAVDLINLGNVYKSMGQFTQAIETHQQALTVARQIKDLSAESSALVNLGVEYDELGQSAKAIEYYREALTIAREIDDRATEGLILNNLGNTLFKTGKFKEAEATLRQGLQAWELVRASLGESDRGKISIFDQQSRTYRLLQRVLVAQNQTDAALEIAERGRARSFVELLSRRLNANSPLAQTVASPTLEQIKQIARSQNATLVEYSITYEDTLVDNKIQPKEVALYIWAIAPSGNITFRQVDLTEQDTSLADLVVASREGMGVQGRGLGVVASANPQRSSQQRQTLYQRLIEPIAQVLPKDPNERVIFIPQQSLFLVPFAALQDESGQYLLEKHTILTAPSIQVLSLTQQQRRRSSVRSSQTSLVVGNPTMPTVPARDGKPSEQLASLPGAEREAQAIAPLLETQAITGDRATKRAILQQMPNARIIHLATHGLLDDFKGVGVPGAIALAPERSRGESLEGNGLLTADEILDLNLNAELVVLSACDTGRGTITGDGVVGLSRSLITAGVPSVLVSLWSVPDAPTAELMVEFYRQLQQNGDKSQELRQAMLKTKEKHPNPRDWAAFTLIGEAE